MSLKGLSLPLLFSFHLISFSHCQHLDSHSRIFYEWHKILLHDNSANSNPLAGYKLGLSLGVPVKWVNLQVRTNGVILYS